MSEEWEAEENGWIELYLIILYTALKKNGIGTNGLMHINSVAHKVYPPILRCDGNVVLVGIKTLVEWAQIKLFHHNFDNMDINSCLWEESEWNVHKKMTQSLTLCVR